VSAAAIAVRKPLGASRREPGIGGEKQNKVKGKRMPHGESKASKVRRREKWLPLHILLEGGFESREVDGAEENSRWLKERQEWKRGEGMSL